MPVLTHSIAGIQFLAIHGSLDPRKKQTEIIARPGRDDIDVRLTGRRGSPHSVVSFNFEVNRSTALAAFDTYANLIGDGPWSVIQNSQNYGKFWVLDVKQISDRAIVNAVGGLFGSEQVEHIVQWTLAHVVPTAT